MSRLSCSPKRASPIAILNEGRGTTGDLGHCSEQWRVSVQLSALTEAHPSPYQWTPTSISAFNTRAQSPSHHDLPLMGDIFDNNWWSSLYQKWPQLQPKFTRNAEKMLIWVNPKEHFGSEICFCCLQSRKPNASPRLCGGSEWWQGREGHGVTKIT